MTLDEFKSLAKSFAEKKNTARGMQDDLDRINLEIRDMQCILLAAMEEQGMSKFSVDGIGTIFSQEKLSVKTPKTPEDREAFFNYLKQTGQFEPMISVNSQTLQAWYKAQVENGVTEIPGLKEVTTYKQLTLRKA